MTTRLSNALRNSALVLAAFVLSLGAAELVLRSFDLTGVYPHQPHQLLTQHDPLLGWGKIPGKVGTHATDEYRITEHINSRGIRGPEYPYHKPDDEFRILILGDSFAEGYSVEFDELFSEILKNALNANSERRYQVINAGTGGYSTDQQLLWFQNEGKLYSPNLTILAFFFNDVWYNQSETHWRASKPVFEMNGNRLALTNVPVPNLSNGHSPRRSVIQESKAWLAQNSYLYATMRHAAGSSASLRSAGEWLGLIQEASDPLGDQFLVFQRPYSDHVQKAWIITEALIEQLKQETLKVGSDLLVLYVPPSFSIYTEEWESTLQQHALSEEHWQVEWPAVELEAICARLGVEFFDLTAEFRQVANAMSSEEQRLYFVRDGHWNADGHRLAGNILFDYMIKR